MGKWVAFTKLAFCKLRRLIVVELGLPYMTSAERNASNLRTNSIEFADRGWGGQNSSKFGERHIWKPPSLASRQVGTTTAEVMAIAGDGVPTHRVPTPTPLSPSPPSVRCFQVTTTNAAQWKTKTREPIGTMPMPNGE